MTFEGLPLEFVTGSMTPGHGKVQPVVLGMVVHPDIKIHHPKIRFKTQTQHQH